MSDRNLIACADVAARAYVAHTEATRPVFVWVKAADLEPVVGPVLAGAQPAAVQELLAASLGVELMPSERLTHARARLVANVIRATAASLGMVVKYPDGTEIDWAASVDVGRAPMVVSV